MVEVLNHPGPSGSRSRGSEKVFSSFYRISPEIVEVIKPPRILLEDVDDNRVKIQQDPPTILVALDFGFGDPVSLHCCVDFSTDRLGLPTVIRRDEEEEVRDPQICGDVQDSDLLTLFVLGDSNGSFKDLFIFHFEH